MEESIFEIVKNIYYIYPFHASVFTTPGMMVLALIPLGCKFLA